MSRFFASFFMRTSSTTTSDFFDISVWRMCLGTSSEKGANAVKYSVRMRATRITRFSLTATRFGRKNSFRVSASLDSCPVKGSSRAGVRLRPTSKLKQYIPCDQTWGHEHVSSCPQEELWQFCPLVLQKAGMIVHSIIRRGQREWHRIATRELGSRTRGYRQRCNRRSQAE